MMKRFLLFTHCSPPWRELYSDYDSMEDAAIIVERMAAKFARHLLDNLTKQWFEWIDGKWIAFEESRLIL